MAFLPSFCMRLSHQRVVSHNDGAKIQLFQQIERDKYFFLSLHILKKGILMRAYGGLFANFAFCNFVLEKIGKYVWHSLFFFLSLQHSFR